MDTKNENAPNTMQHHTTVERKSEREFVVRGTINGSAPLVFEAWTKADLFSKWWVPKSCGLLLHSCEMDVRVGGKYRLVFRYQDSTMEVFGVYREVRPHSRLVWTNEEGESGETITTVTFDAKDGKTLLLVHDLYPSKESLDAAITSGATGGMPEQLDQLEELLANLSSSTVVQ